MDPYPRRFRPPELNEEADDDPDEADESAGPNQFSRMYSFDSPGFGWLQLNDPRIDEGSYRMDAWEYMRIGINEDPAGNGQHGSRASNWYEWHVAHHVKKNAAGNWERTTGDEAEVFGVNDIGPGHILP